jgi:hypothetical protein
VDFLPKSGKIAKIVDFSPKGAILDKTVDFSSKSGKIADIVPKYTKYWSMS